LDKEIKAIMYYFGNLQNDVKSLLFRLAEDTYAARDVAEALVFNFDELPQNARSSLFIKLTNKEEALR
jgi:hypothetical protein